jgi:hypothetical protein
MLIRKTRKQSANTQERITRLSRKHSNKNNTNKNILDDYRNKYTLRIYKLNGFKIKVYDSIYQIIIRIGHEANDCIRMLITKQPDKTYNTYNTQINSTNLEQESITAELELFNYQSSCIMTENMERNKGTKLMMTTIIQFVNTKYPMIKQINLLDASIYKCDKLPSYKNTFSLYDYYLFKYGTTYYKHNYDAEMIYQSDIEAHAINKKLIEKFKINKSVLEKYLLKLIGKIPVSSIKEDIKELINVIHDDELAIDFIKRYRFGDNTCYLMHFLFEFIKKVINISTFSRILKNDVIEKETYQTLLPYCFIKI